MYSADILPISRLDEPTGAMVRWPPDFNSTSAQQAVLLPTRALVSADVPPFIDDQSRTTNEALALIQLIWDGNKMSAGRLVADWKRAMCTKTARDAGRSLLENLESELARPQEIIGKMLQIIEDWVRLPCE